jgi:hypothetical protein
LAEGPTGPVALKTADSDDQRARLRREAAVLRRVDHRYVVQLVDADPGGDWLALELVRGPTLTTWGRQRPLSDKVELCARLAEAVSHLHAVGYLHGDLKPGNVMVDEYGHPRLIDLGTAQTLRAPRLRPGFQGTLGFVAPELLRGNLPTPASDVYSLGAVLYHLLTGVPPFRAADPAALAYLPLSSLPEPPSGLVSRLPRAVEGLTLRMLARTAAQRPELKGLSGQLRRARRSTPDTPVLGMRREREALRRFVAAACEGNTGVAVVHGPQGCGRRTLISEAVTAARREGLRVIEGLATEPRALLEGLRLQERYTLIWCEDDGRRTTELAGRLMAEQLPALLLIRALRPVMPLTGLGARHLSPTPLAEEHVATLLELAGQDPRDAKQLVERTRGLPGAVMGYVNPPSAGVPGLTAPQVELLKATAHGAMTVEDLAALLGVGEHQLLDLAEPLLDKGLLQELEDGAALKAVRS